MKNKIISHDGSIQNIEGIPRCFKERYKTVWEFHKKISLILLPDEVSIYVNHKV